VPLPATQPWLWKWDTLYPLAKRAGEIITIERGGDRRVLALANPGLHGLPFTSSTLWGAIQYLGPNESAPAHPLESIFFENHPDQVQPVRDHNLSEQLYTGVGLVESDHLASPAHSPLLRYRWEETDRMLESLHHAHAGPIATVEYHNPITGALASPTLACEMSRIWPGARTVSRRKTESSIHVVFRGSGRSVVNGLAMEWGPGDIFVTPSWTAVDHEAFEQADLFAINDSPVLQALHLYREETLVKRQAIVKTFQPK
jgi:gentisate 1,2-dioxygenase